LLSNNLQNNIEETSDWWIKFRQRRPLDGSFQLRDAVSTQASTRWLESATSCKCAAEPGYNSLDLFVKRIT
jgi:hypothetical protein